jgi:hypothetical protein
MRSFGDLLSACTLTALVFLACGCPAGAGPAGARLPVTAMLPMDVQPDGYAYVVVTIRGQTGSVRIEPDSDVTYLLNSARESLSLPLRDGMTPLPPFQLDRAMTAETLVTVASPEQQRRWLEACPDLLAILGMDVLGTQPLLVDRVGRRFGWGDYLRLSDDPSVVKPAPAAR